MRTETYSIARQSTATRDGRRALLGREAVITTETGQRLVGTVQDGGTGNLPIVVLSDGRWQRCRDTIRGGDLMNVGIGTITDVIPRWDRASQTWQADCPCGWSFHAATLRHAEVRVGEHARDEHTAPCADPA